MCSVRLASNGQTWKGRPEPTSEHTSSFDAGGECGFDG